MNDEDLFAAYESPLAEGRELKYLLTGKLRGEMLSPLAEGRELKSPCHITVACGQKSPLAEGRELKFNRRKSRQSKCVAPRGGA